jgi:hypothetical protein
MSKLTDKETEDLIKQGKTLEQIRVIERRRELKAQGLSKNAINKIIRRENGSARETQRKADMVVAGVRGPPQQLVGTCAGTFYFVVDGSGNRPVSRKGAGQRQ